MTSWKNQACSAGKASGIDSTSGPAQGRAVAHLPAILTDWFAARDWQPRRYQLEMLDAARTGQHALLVAPTGAGKTLAGFLPTLADLIDHPAGGLHTLYISPLKALAVDVQRNLLTPVEEMGLDIRIETRTGDTPSDRKKRQRERPPQILLTTPESLSLLLSYPDSVHMFAGLKTVVIDEVHAFASGKRGDLLNLSLARLQSLAPALRRVALSATVAEPEAYLRWLSADPVTLVKGDPGAPPDIAILLPEGRVPWSGHSGTYAVPQVMAEIASHKTTIVFSNTRGLAELIFQQLWSANDLKLPIGIHHGSLDIAARRKVEAAMADGRLRGLVATSSLDLGVDWAGVDCVIQMGAPKGASRLLQRIGRSNHRLDQASEAIIVPGNRFEYLEAQAALDAIGEGRLDGEVFRPGGLDVLAQHLMACACAAPFDEAAMLAEVQTSAPFAEIDAETFARILDFIATGGYALRAYDKFRRLVKGPDGRWRVTHPKFAAQHRLNAGIIVDTPMLDVRFKNGRRLGQLDEYFAATLTPGDTFFFSGLSLEVVQIEATDLYVRASTKRARIPSYAGARLPLTTHLAERVRGFLHDRSQWDRFPHDVREWLEMQGRRSVLPAPDQLLVETFPRDGLHYLVAYSFEGWNAHQSLAMLLTKRMEARGMKPLGFVSSDYAFAIWSLDPVVDPQALFSADILADEFVAWVENSALLKRAFREVAIIGGLVERQHPGKKKSGRQVTFSTDLIYDVLRRYEPDHLLLTAAWADARARMTDVGRLGALLDRAGATMVHKHLDRVSPLAVPILMLIGREHIAGGEAEDALLIEAELLAAEAMR
jgi:ATP-dependent helicase Lhr and Lhr-like helicase